VAKLFSSSMGKNTDSRVGLDISPRAYMIGKLNSCWIAPMIVEWATTA
jgi:hypothetical protein